MNAHTPAIFASLLLSASALSQTFHYELAAGSSYLREECLGPCACAIRITDPSPMTGRFALTFDHQDQWTAYYTISDVTFQASSQFEPNLTLHGTGTYHAGGDFALTHRLTLDLASATSTQVFHYDSGEVLVPAGHHYPQISITATTGIVGCQRRTVTINAAPVPVCDADLGSQGGAIGYDGQLDNNDFVAFIELFFSGDPSADIGSQGGGHSSDGFFDNNDFIVFIDAFFTGDGCP